MLLNGDTPKRVRKIMDSHEEHHRVKSEACGKKHFNKSSVMTQKQRDEWVKHRSLAKNGDRHFEIVSRQEFHIRMNYLRE